MFSTARLYSTMIMITLYNYQTIAPLFPPLAHPLKLILGNGGDLTQKNIIVGLTIKSPYKPQ